MPQDVFYVEMWVCVRRAKRIVEQKKYEDIDNDEDGDNKNNNSNQTVA